MRRAQRCHPRRCRRRRYHMPPQLRLESREALVASRPLVLQQLPAMCLGQGCQGGATADRRAASRRCWHCWLLQWPPLAKACDRWHTSPSFLVRTCVARDAPAPGLPSGACAHSRGHRGTPPTPPPHPPPHAPPHPTRPNRRLWLCASTKSVWKTAEIHRSKCPRKHPYALAWL